MNQRKRFVVGQQVFSLVHQRAGQLLGLSGATCIVRFSDNGEVEQIGEDSLRVASWDEIRSSGKSTRTKRVDA